VVQHLPVPVHNRWLCQPGVVDLDLGQVRAFVAAADQQHITRAARSLHLTQQALSKRLARLEDMVGVLLIRGPSGVTLTQRGQQFLPYARDLLALADAATAAARASPPPALRVDVWGHLHPVLPLVRAFARNHCELVLEVSMRRNLPLALDAVAQRQLDVAFGYLPGLPGPPAPDLVTGPITCTRLVALVRADRYSPDLPALSVADLGRGRLWFPGQGSSPELNAYAHEYAQQVHTTLSTDGTNLGLEVLVERLTAEPDTVTLVGSDWPVHDLPGLRVLPVHPVPLYPWYAAWRATSPHPDITTLITYLQHVGHRPRPGDDIWLPAAYSRLPNARLGR